MSACGLGAGVRPRIYVEVVASGDIGEGLVGSYMRYIEGCPIVLYNSFLSDQQGEVDVVAVKPAEPGEPREVFLCEVTTHIGGLNSQP
jgi:hypothetical protein